MTFKLQSRRFAICLLIPVLTSCETSVPISQPNYSVILGAEIGKQKAADCEFMMFRELGPLPTEILAPLEAAGKVEPEMRTPEQVGLIAWFNRDAKKIEGRKKLCGF